MGGITVVNPRPDEVISSRDIDALELEKLDKLPKVSSCNYKLQLRTERELNYILLNVSIIVLANSKINTGLWIPIGIILRYVYIIVSLYCTLYLLSLLKDGLSNELLFSLCQDYRKHLSLVAQTTAYEQVYAHTLVYEIYTMNGLTFRNL